MWYISSKGENIKEFNMLSNCDKIYKPVCENTF